MNNLPDFLQKYEKLSPDFFTIIQSLQSTIMDSTVLDIKTKLLILLAVDAYAGSSGVKGISMFAKKNGVSENEIVEAIKIAYIVGGNRILHTADSIFE